MAKTSNETGIPLQEMAEEAMKGYEQVLKTGLKVQQEAAQWWSKALQPNAPKADWQKCVEDFTSAASTVIPTAQKQRQEALNLLEKNNKSCVELVKKATEAAQATGLAESQAKWLEFWKLSMDAARSNTEALSAVNAKMVESYMDFVEKSRRTTGWTSAKAA